MRVTEYEPPTPFLGTPRRCIDIIYPGLNKHTQGLEAESSGNGYDGGFTANEKTEEWNKIDDRQTNKTDNVKVDTGTGTYTWMLKNQTLALDP